MVAVSEDDPCPGIAKKIYDTIMGNGMPGGKSLATRAVQQITGLWSLFDGHQTQIDGLVGRLRNLMKKWKRGNCPDDGPGGPSGVNDWIDNLSRDNMLKLFDDYHQYKKDLELIATGAATVAVVAEAAELYESLAAFAASLTVGDVLLFGAEALI